MLIPYHTDAPIYHFPWATIGLGIVNCVMLFATTGMIPTEETFMNHRFLMLEFDGLHPGQWLTNNFMHADILHLVGNLFFLWGFGLVVEGKLGWMRFLAIYLLMGIVYGAFVQTLMFIAGDRQGVALGASGVIFAVMACAVLWAPKNDMHCFLWMGVFSRTLDVSILTFGMIYFALQCFLFVVHGMELSSEALHLAGLGIGIPTGLLLLHRGWVDCEGWDYYSLYFASDNKRHKAQHQRHNTRAGEFVREARHKRADAIDGIDRTMQQALETANDKVIVALYQKHRGDLAEGSRLTNKSAVALISALHREQEWVLSYPIMAGLLRGNTPESTISIRLRLAHILLAKSDRPRQALAVLKKLPVQIPPAQAAARDQLVSAAERAIARGSVEFDFFDC